MKRWRLLVVAVIIGGLVSCTKDDPILKPQLPMHTMVAGSTLINEGAISLGSVETDNVFDMYSTILTPEGRVEEHTLNSCALLAATVVDGVQDPDSPVKNATLINKGTITIHTHDLVEKYKDQIQTPDHPERKFKYLRLIGLFAGENGTVINDGVINVYFDHDPAVTSTIYAMGLVASDGATIINNGEINFYGTGTLQTRMRGVATFGDRIAVENHGLISADVAISDDSRAITTGGTDSSVYNDGIIRLRLSGTVPCVTRYGNNQITNAGTIEITSTSYPAEYIASTAGTTKLICALYEPLSPGRIGIPPMINRGTIKITIDDTAPADPERAAFGMLMDLQSAQASQLNVNIINKGSIVVNNPGNYEMAEASFRAKPASANGACKITMGTWKTRLRDFSTTHDLFQATGVNMDFSEGVLMLEADKDYAYGTSYSIAPEDIMYDYGQGAYYYKYAGYETMSVVAADPNFTLMWDKENKTASLYR